MRRSNLFVLLIAIVMGGIAAFMARNWITAHATVQPAAPMGTMVVAAAPLTFGTVLTRENINEISWSAGRLPEGAYATKDDLLKDGRRAVLAPVGRDEPILKTKVTGPGQRASLSALLDEGMRAVTVRVDDVRGVAGFVLPGDRVDVVLIRTVPGASSPTENVSDILLQHVKVLAVDQLVNERQLGIGVAGQPVRHPALGRATHHVVVGHDRPAVAQQGRLQAPAGHGDVDRLRCDGRHTNRP